jgi:hypothetical protein
MLWVPDASAVQQSKLSTCFLTELTLLIPVKQVRDTEVILWENCQPSPQIHILDLSDCIPWCYFSVFLYPQVLLLNWKWYLDTWSEFRILARILYSWCCVLICCIQQSKQEVYLFSLPSSLSSSLASSFFYFFDTVWLCTLDWSQICDPPASASECWDYRWDAFKSGFHTWLIYFC